MSLLALEKALSEIALQGLDCFDPPRLCYLQAMVRRAKTKEHAVGMRLEQKITMALKQYQSDCLIARQIDHRRAEIREQPDPSLPTPQKKTAAQQIAELTQTINQDDHGASGESNVNGVRELKSLRLFRAACVEHDANKLVTQAIKNGPKTPGPLNSHALAVKSLTKLRELSPEYLQHFIAYADTLLWLDENGESSGDNTSAAARGKNKSKASTKRPLKYKSVN